MKKIFCMTAILATLLVVSTLAEEGAELKTPKDKLSYALGVDVATTLRRQSIEIDPAVFIQGLNDAYAGHKLLLSDEEARGVLTDMQKQMRKKMEEARTQLADNNMKAGETFLAENKKVQGVVTLPSGLQYKVVKAGDGKKPSLDDTVVCNYRGTLIDGKEFDSSYKRNQPATFPVKGVIKGWTEALQLMPVGSKWQLFIPPGLAYGERGAGGDIGPNATLIFEVELVSIKDKS
ncbi:MAG: FKBP-type peptidyl-prolyl cis-trans isomerase [Acidobacteria bacterium]|nr:FKBP-type peptidyl-prolyl cis-trans isomerase [Acidobacteriota bacterium]